MIYLLFFLLTSCVINPQVPAPQSQPPPAESVPTSAQPVPALSWEKGHPERASWSTHLLTLVDQSLLTQLDGAKDVTRFCPNYPALSRKQKITLWAELAVWIAYYESGWNPLEHYHEPPPLGYDSIGLLQLSYEDTRYKFCDLNRVTKSLDDPIKNLDCGARIIAYLTAKDGVISSASHGGASAYWSTLRGGHKVDQIAAHTGSLSFCGK